MNPPPVKLLLVGDVMLGRLVNERLREQPPAYPWGNVLPLFHEVDWRACNLECVISDHGTPWARSPKTLHLQTDASNLRVLKAAHIDAVSVANNHALDYNHRGMVEMLRLLDGAGIAHCGAGLNREQASGLVISEVRGVKIGMLAFTDNEPSWEADMERPGIHYVPVEKPDERTARLLGLVTLASAEVDVLIVSAHWGGNWGYRPPGAHTRLAHDLIRAGADVVYGHSPHVCRGVELFEGGIILYSTGDFVDDYVLHPLERNDMSWMFELHVRQDHVSQVHMHPVLIQDCQACLAGPNIAESMRDWMRELCASLGTTTTENPGSPSLIIDLQRRSRIDIDLPTSARLPPAADLVA